MRNTRDKTSRLGRSTFQDVVEQSLDCVCVHDIEGTILSVNPAFVRAVHAGSESDLVGTNLLGILDPRVAGSFPAYLRTIREHGTAEGTMRVLTRDSEVRIFDYRNVLRRTGDGMVVYGMARDVTESRRTTTATAESERRFRTLFERNVAAVLIIAMDGSFIDVNETTVRQLRAPSRDALLATNIDDYYADAITRAMIIDRLRTKGEVSMHEMRVRRWDGSLTWAVINCTLVDFGKSFGQVILTTALDISNRKRLEEKVTGELRRREHDYRAIFAHAHDPILVLEPHTERVLDVNDAACSVYGLTRSEFLERSMLDLSNASSDRSSEVLAAGGRFIDFETVQFKADGTMLVVEVSAGAMTYGQKSAILSINRDVTEKRRIEEERRNTYARLSAVAREWTSTFDAVPSPIVVADESFCIRRVNRAAAALLNRDVADVACLSLDELENEPWRTVAALCRHGTGVSVEVANASSERVWDVTLTVQPEGTMPESRYIIILRDVTATHELQKSLLRIETMSAMGSLVAGVLHEVRNPLFSISATVDVLEARATEGEASAKYIGRLRNDVQRLRKIMADLLEYGRPHGLHRQDASIAGIVSNAAAGCLPFLEAAQVRMEVDPSPARVSVDVDRMRQVFHNLIENAIQHSPRGGTIAVRISEELRRGANWVTVSVEDDGPGFAPSDLRQIFEPFFTKRRGGTGLGLSIVRKIVEEHEGTVDAANRPEGGAVLSVALRQ